jgi:hypothetical protein
MWAAVEWVPAGQHVFPHPPRDTGLKTVAKTCEQPVWSQASGDVEASAYHSVDLGVGLLKCHTEGLATNSPAISNCPYIAIPMPAR